MQAVAIECGRTLHERRDLDGKPFGNGRNAARRIGLDIRRQCLDARDLAEQHVGEGRPLLAPHVGETTDRFGKARADVGVARLCFGFAFLGLAEIDDAANRKQRLKLQRREIDDAGKAVTQC